MNKEQQQINKAVKKGVNKLVAFAFDKKLKGGDTITVDVNPTTRLMHVWAWSSTVQITGRWMVTIPFGIKEIDAFNRKVETLIAEIKRDYK